MDSTVRHTRHLWDSLLHAFVLVLCSCGALSDISLQGNGYRGIVVAVSPRVQDDDVPNLYESLQTVFNSASKHVFSKLDNRAFFEEVILLLPKTFKFQSDLNTSDPRVKFEVSSRPNFASPHFVIESEGVFGNTPYTLQFGPCGCQGLRTVLPAHYVVSGEGEPLGEQWLRLRYGVFSTEHFDGDPLYPKGVLSKQDVLCRSSIRDTVLHSKDFHNANLSGESPWKPITLKVVKETPLRLVVAWNIGKTVRSVSATQKRTQNALKKFATRMAPQDSMMAMVYFGEDILDGDDQLLSMDTQDKRKYFANYFPTFPKGKATLVDALNKAKNMLVRANGVTGSVAGGTILLVTGQNSTEEEHAQIRQMLQDAKITLHVLMIPQYDGDGTLERLAAESGGKVFSSASTDQALSLSVQADAISSMVLQSFCDSEKPNLVSLGTEIWNNLYIGEPQELAIDLDISDASILQVGITKKTADPAFDNTITLISPGNANSFTSRDKEFSETSDFSLREFVVSNPSRGTWTLKIDPRSDVQESVMVDVKAKPGESEDIITVSVWMSQSYADVDPSKPLLVYAEVRKGVKPIKGAAVEATVKIPTGGDVKFKLVDNGRGDPDITAGDGIYSRYFTGFSSKGSYDLSVTVKGEAGAVAIGTRSGGEFPCCGSEFPATPSEPTGSFARYSQYGSFITSTDRPPGDIFPPSRVTDLRVTGVDHYNMRVTLQWTAPGNDFDNGTADFYEIRYFTREVDFAAEFETAGTVIDSFDIDGLTGSPKVYGQLETATVFNLKCGREPERCYFALRANDKQNRGSVSNVVSVQFTQNPVQSDQPGIVTDGQAGIGDGSGRGSGNGTNSWYVENKRGGPFWGLAIGIPIALLLIIIVAVILFIVIRRRKDDRDVPPTQPSKHLQNGDAPVKNGNAPDANISSKYPSSVWSTSISPVNSYSADYLLDRYEEEKRRKGQKPPASAPEKEDLPPSSDEPSVEKAQEDPVWWMPQERQIEGNGDTKDEEQHQQAPVYATVDYQAKRTSPRRTHTAV